MNSFLTEPGAREWEGDQLEDGAINHLQFGAAGDHQAGGRSVERMLG